MAVLSRSSRISVAGSGGGDAGQLNIFEGTKCHFCAPILPIPLPWQAPAALCSILFFRFLFLATRSLPDQLHHTTAGVRPGAIVRRLWRGRPFGTKKFNSGHQFHRLLSITRSLFTREELFLLFVVVVGLLNKVGVATQPAFVIN